METGALQHKRLPSPSRTCHLPEHVAASRKEMSTLADAVDRQAMNQPRRVADLLLCQRYKALDMSIAVAGWECAKHLEPMSERRELINSRKRRAHACQGAPRRSSHQVLPRRCGRSRETPRKGLCEKKSGCSRRERGSVAWALRTSSTSQSWVSAVAGR